RSGAELPPAVRPGGHPVRRALRRSPARHGPDRRQEPWQRHGQPAGADAPAHGRGLLQYRVRQEPAHRAAPAPDGLLADHRRRGGGQVNDFLPLRGRDLLAFEGPRRAISQAYADAGIAVADLDFAEVHDCFTIAELLIYEAMGLAPAGQGHRALDDGTVLRDGG